MERIMGRADTPVRKVLNYASDNLAKGLPIIYILTVIGTERKSLRVLKKRHLLKVFGFTVIMNLFLRI